jgi:hypothetical protein
MLHKDYDRKSSVETKITGRASQATFRQDDMIADKPPVVK